ncbi:hypothetical protein TRAPUB_7698 [Trametes pubescens]|uniref:Cysteine-rich transmembrane CYSTM domain-containing protein n=1 Tax=Trametes pubescens TaxID=154538 RepID=A0A1M2V2T2_TRAPU|nr:hypothetical protein TRAPUB_7698 [Trametes pubescens]
MRGIPAGGPNCMPMWGMLGICGAIGCCCCCWGSPKAYPVEGSTCGYAAGYCCWATPCGA